MSKRIRYNFTLAAGLILSILLLGACQLSSSGENVQNDPVDYVNPYMGNISLLLVPTYPTIHLPNSMLRVTPNRIDYTDETLKGLPILLTSHRGKKAFTLSPTLNQPYLGNTYETYAYDNESCKPYQYTVDLEQGEERINVNFIPSHQSALYTFTLPKNNKEFYLSITTEKGALSQINKNSISGYQILDDDTTKVYLYAEFNHEIRQIQEKDNTTLGGLGRLVFEFPMLKSKSVSMRYGISFISEEQSRKNLEREILSFEVNPLLKEGRSIWNTALQKIKITAKNENDAKLFYTSLYRTYERMICVSEDGQFWSGIDKQVHKEKNLVFFTDDWIWDTYRATHPLRVLIDSRIELQMIKSYLEMAEENKNGWLATFPEITGDSRRMNCNHGIAMLLDAYSKGLNNFNLERAYEAGLKAITEKSLAPWSHEKAGYLNRFFHENGYFPALRLGQKETEPDVQTWEKRQAVAVTLGTAYDYWCLGRMAEILGKTEEAREHYTLSFAYRNIFNPNTKFFHPKDEDGNFIMPFDYTYSGGQGARDYYGENNAWIYRWDLPFNIVDLIHLMGGKSDFVAALDSTLRTPIEGWKFNFYHQLPDQTGNIGQFSVSNEPALHVPYLYNYAAQPWKTQKLIRKVIKEWFRNDLLGMPGDEDGGGMSAFVVFSMLGFYPMPVGLPVYVIGSPMLKYAEIDLGGGKKLIINAPNTSDENKYIQSVTLNGKKWDNCWFTHNEIVNGATLEFTMGPTPNYEWGIGTPPPSFKLNMD